MEAAEAGGQLGLAAVLGDDAGARGEERFGAGAAKEGEGGGVLGGGNVGRVEEDEVKGIGAGEQAGDEGGYAAVIEGVAGGDVHGLEVLAKSGEGGAVAFGEEDVGGAAAEGLDADSSSAGVKVGESGAGKGWRENVEEGLAEAVAGGAGAGSTRGDQRPRAVKAGDDAHGRSIQ